MARNGGNRSCGVVCSVSEEIQTKLGILAVSPEQRLMDCLWHDRAFALIFLQLCLAFLNVRGSIKNRAQ